jgi:hypothetical protein
VGDSMVIFRLVFVRTGMMLRTLRENYYTNMTAKRRMSLHCNRIVTEM